MITKRKVDPEELPTKEEIDRVRKWEQRQKYADLNTTLEIHYEESQTICVFQGLNLADERISKKAVLGALLLVSQMPRV